MVVDWNRDVLPFQPNYKTYRCSVSARSPAPSPVRNLSIISYSFNMLQQVLLNLSWLPPSHPNGVLNDYNICIGPSSISTDSETLPESPHTCAMIEVSFDVLNLSWRLKFECNWCHWKYVHEMSFHCNIHILINVARCYKQNWIFSSLYLWRLLLSLCAGIYQ